MHYVIDNKNKQLLQPCMGLSDIIGPLYDANYSDLQASLLFCMTLYMHDHDYSTMLHIAIILKYSVSGSKN